VRAARQLHARTAVLEQVRLPVVVRQRKQSGEDRFSRSHVESVGLGRVDEPRFGARSDAARGRVQR